MRILSSLLVAVLTAPFAFAQEAPPPPSPELAKLEQGLGNWTGNGTASMGGMEMQWSATMTSRKVLNGYFFIEDMSIDIGMPAQLVFRTVSGWDPTEERFKFFSMSNMGGVHYGNTYWPDDHTAVNSSTMIEEGQVVTDRSVVTFDGDTFTMNMDRAVGGGPFEVYVTGTFERGGDGFTAAAASAGGEMMPMPAGLEPLEKTVGDWRMTAEMSPAPGAPMIEVTANQHIRFALGGQVVHTVLKGDPIPGFPGPAYEAEYYQGWDAGAKKVVGFWVSNMGEMMMDETHAMGDGTIVSIGAMVHNGSPTSTRGTMTPEGDGFHYEGWHLANADAPALVFQGHLKPLK